MYIHVKYISKQARLLAPYIKNGEKLLDFGCGDLTLAESLKISFPKANITGVDVVDAGHRVKKITYRLYDGKKLPFAAKSFNTTIVYHVFHHCDDPHKALGDVIRVTKRQILVVEPVYRNTLDLFLMKILDRVSNGWRGVMIPMPFTFQTERTWEDWVRQSGWKIQSSYTVGVLPVWLPVGVARLFVLTPAMRSGTEMKS